MKRAILSVTLVMLTASLASPAAVFDFSTTTRTFIGGPEATPPDDSYFGDGGAYTETLFLVGNLTNGCGLYPNRTTVRSEAGTDCGWTNLAKRIDYNEGADDFTLSEDTDAVLELIVKLGHPEEPDPNSSRRNQDQLEQFDVFLVSPMGEILLAELLDDVSKADFGDEDNGYYHYMYNASVIPQGTYSPSFVAKDGSIEFLTILRARPDQEVPAPSTVLLLATGFGLVPAARSRRSRSRTHR